MNKLILAGVVTASKIIGFQFLMVALVSLLVLGMQNQNAALSSFVGGSCGILPNIVLAMFLFSSAGATQLKTTMSRFYRGCSIKLILTSIVLAIILKSQLFLVGFVFFGFAIALVAHVLAPIFIH
ncbi:ATP synthase I chain [Catenovulum agarivorans DS-2]|uniref:ATP synthase I chain n=1 Tax=Catenovulum agarivorans DS-2 TaxID=1328313 RepID=W7QVG7_9ALTE|nr:ATP synthase subunit I [Catenovulum agarivorans]EWH09285.1 ATP synthase I chain [Catenovulum agarivorans DS-2]